MKLAAPLSCLNSSYTSCILFSLSFSSSLSVCSSGFSALWFFRNAKAKICHCSFFSCSDCKSLLSPGLVLMGNLYLWLHIYYLTWRHLSSSAKVEGECEGALGFQMRVWVMGNGRDSCSIVRYMYESVQVVCATEKCLSLRNSLVKFFICFRSTHN